MKADEEANTARIKEQKSRTAISTPLEPLIVSLLKSFTDDADLEYKLGALYTASNPQSSYEAIPCGRASYSAVLC